MGSPTNNYKYFITYCTWNTQGYSLQILYPFRYKCDISFHVSSLSVTRSENSEELWAVKSKTPELAQREGFFPDVTKGFTWYSSTSVSVKQSVREQSFNTHQNRTHSPNPDPDPNPDPKPNCKSGPKPCQTWIRSPNYNVRYIPKCACQVWL